MPNVRCVGIDLVCEDENVGIHDAPGGFVLLARPRIHHPRDEAVLVQASSLESAPFAFDEIAVVRTGDGVGPPEPSHRGEDIDGVAFAGVVVEDAVRRGVEGFRQRISLIAQQGDVFAGAGQVFVAREAGDDERAEEHILFVHVVIAPVRLHPGVVDWVEEQVLTGLDGVAAIIDGGLRGEAVVILPCSLQVFRAPQVEHAAIERPLGAGDVEIMDVRGTFRGDARTRPLAVSRRQIPVKAPGLARNVPIP